MMSSTAGARTAGTDQSLTILRTLAKNAATGGTAAIAIWCIMLLLQVLPGVAADTSGIVLFGIIGVAAGVSRLRSFTIVVLQVAAALVILLAVTPASAEIAQYWVRRDALPNSPVDAVIVLSGGLNPDTSMSGEALDHLISALELIRSGQSHVLVTTTTHVVFETGRVWSDADQSRILSLFPSPVEWIRTPLTSSTHDEAVESWGLLVHKGLRRVAVVSSPMHSRRACATFEAVGFSVVCVPARLRGLGGVPVATMPRYQLAIFGQWVYELSAIAEYSVRGWLRT